MTIPKGLTNQHNFGQRQFKNPKVNKYFSEFFQRFLDFIQIFVDL